MGRKFLFTHFFGNELCDFKVTHRPIMLALLCIKMLIKVGNLRKGRKYSF